MVADMRRLIAGGDIDEVKDPFASAGVAQRFPGALSVCTVFGSASVATGGTSTASSTATAITSVDTELPVASYHVFADALAFAVSARQIGLLARAIPPAASAPSLPTSLPAIPEAPAPTP